MVKFKVMETSFVMHKKSDQSQSTVMIAEYDDNTGIWIPSSLSNYIFDNYSNKSINTQLSVAYLICDFMNFILEQIEVDDSLFEVLKKEGLFGLNFVHGALFLDYLGNEKEPSNNYETVIRKENELTRFYDHLYRNGITSDNMQISFSIDKKKSPMAKKGEKVLISPFSGDDRCGIKIKYPSKDGRKKPILKDMRKADWELLLEVAEEETPDIALGVALQIMGGFRAGEVVNSTVTSYKKDEKGNKLIFSIRDRQNDLFSARGVKTNKSQVKRPREDQPVFNFNGMLFKILDSHLERLNARRLAHTSALFIDSKGNAMSGEVYMRRFYLLKRAFLKKLEENKPSLAKEYGTNYTWGSHIGRHIYTNYLIKTGLCNDSLEIPSARILANLRGDDNILSAQVYIDKKAIIESIQERLDQLSRMATNV